MWLTSKSNKVEVFPVSNFVRNPNSYVSGVWSLPSYEKVKVNQSHYRPEVPRGFQEVKVPRLRDNVQPA